MLRRPPAAGPDEWIRRLAWLGVVAIAAWLRLWHLGDQILIDDEWHSLHQVLNGHWRETLMSFGHADYSIPLTLFFQGLAETVGLSDWRMRALPLLAGLATVIVVPMLLRPWLSPRERLLLAALIAISPLLVHFSRYVRPYALIVPLGLMALVWLWRWWFEGRRHGRAAGFVASAVLAAWLHPLTVLMTGAALTWFGVAGLWHGWRARCFRPLLELLLVGAVTVALCALLLMPPLIADPGAMHSKLGVDPIRPDTLAWGWELVTGSAGLPVVLTTLALAAVGGWRLFHRERLFAAYLAWVASSALAVIAIMQPAWIHHALVLVRYLLPVQPLVLMLIAIAVLWLADRLAQLAGGWKRSTGTGLAAGLLIWLYLAGPLPSIYQWPNSFTNSLLYQFDYDRQRNAFAQVLDEVAVPSFYRRIAADRQAAAVVEAPWRFETHFSALPAYQQAHGLPVQIGMISGLCTDWTHGELRPDPEHRIRLRQFVFLGQLLRDPGEAVRYVVLHRRPGVANAREVADIAACIDAFRERFGAPWHESGRAVVFRIGGRDAA